jgi:ABC-type phosphate transport system permease subunit
MIKKICCNVLFVFCLVTEVATCLFLSEILSDFKPTRPVSAGVYFLLADVPGVLFGFFITAKF